QRRQCRSYKRLAALLHATPSFVSNLGWRLARRENPMGRASHCRRPLSWNRLLREPGTIWDLLTMLPGKLTLRWKVCHALSLSIPVLRKFRTLERRFWPVLGAPKRLAQPRGARWRSNLA